MRWTEGEMSEKYVLAISELLRAGYFFGYLKQYHNKFNVKTQSDTSQVIVLPSLSRQ
jgi:hypothetical protein